MAEILDVINRFTYEVEDTELVQATQQIQNQVQGLTVLAQRQQQLQQAFDRTAANEIEKRTRIANLIQRTKGSIEQTTAAIGKQVQENQKLQNAIVKEIGLINTLDARLRVLREDKAKAFDVKDIQRYNREIEQTQKRLSSLTSTSKGGILGGAGSAILQGVGIGTGIGLITQGVGLLKTFIADSIRLANETEGVKRAFDRLNSPSLLSNLQKSTRGTVSDLELMRNAVKFENLGLPLNRMAEALSFVRQRARDTGMDVEKLVESLTLGIANKSLLRLDNLGLSAQRIREEFKKTGDFAQAAFNIIAEESAKAGNAIDTFADKQDRLNAKIGNASARFGILVNYIKGSFADFITDSSNPLANPFGAVFTGLTNAQEDTQQKSISMLDKYMNEYERTDELGRKNIEAQVYSSYQELIRTQQRFERIGLSSTADVLAQQFGLYQNFFQQIQGFNGKKVDFNNFTRGDLLGLRQDELQELKKSGDEELGLLSAGEASGKAGQRIKERVRQIQDALNLFSTAVKKTKKEARSNKIRTRDLIEQTPEQWEAEINKIVAQLARLRKPFSDTILAGNTGVVDNAPVNATGQDSNQIISQRNAIRRTEKEQQEAADKAKAARELRVQQEKDAFNTIADAAIQSYGIILQAQINAADAEIAIRQTRVNAAIELAKDGNQEILEIEQRRLEESIKEREKFAQRQAAINAALTISQSVLAIATAAGETGAGAIVIVPAVIAAIAAGFAAVTALSTESTPGFKDGVVDLQGKGNGRSDSIPANLSKGESVITADATLKNKEILRAMNNGAVFSMPNMYAVNNTSNTTTLDMGGVIKELKNVKKAVANNAFKQDIFFNEHGVGTLTQKAISADRRRWS